MRRFVNTTQFSPVIKDGIPPEDSMYYNSWYKDQVKFIKEGYSVGGVRITGDHYYFLNFWLVRGVDHKTKRKALIPPRFLEFQYDYAHALEKCRIEEKNMIILKRRQIGMTEFHAAIGGKEFSFYPASQTVYVAGLEFYTEQLFNNTIRGLNDQYDNEFYKRRNPDRGDYARASYDEYLFDEEGKKTKVTKGLLSEIYAITAKNNPQAVSSRCFGKGTKILMFDGSIKYIENIKIGDKVMGPDGGERTVFELHNGISDLYELDQKYGDKIIVNKDHLLYLYHKPLERKKPGNGKYVQNNFNDPDISKVDDEHFLISTEDYFNKSKTFKRYSYHEKANRIEFSKRIKEPYFVGLWLGDGSSDRSEITTMDAEIVEYLYLLAFQYGMSVKVKSKPGDNASSYYLSSAKRYKVKGVENQLHKLLKELQIFKNKHIPDAIRLSSVSDRLEFLAGLIDSDGTLSISKYPHYSITNKHKHIAEGIVFIARSLGFHSTSTEGSSFDNKGKYCGLSYKVYISGDIWDIPCKIARKQFAEDNLSERKKALRKTSFDCKFIGQGEYYGFSCDKDQLFLLSDFTIVHNSPSFIVFEEAGVFPGVRQAYDFVKPSLYAEGIKTGMAIIVGCVCAGTKVFANDGSIINIEDLHKSHGILGYNKKEVCKENITHLNPPQKKLCYRIITNTGRELECSFDHPILWSNRSYVYSERRYVDGERKFIKAHKKAIFKESKDIRKGDQIAIPKSIPYFGDKKMWEPRLIGWLIGDGTYGKDHSPRMANCDDEINDVLLSRFDAKVNIQRPTKDGRIYKEIRLKGICHKLREIGIYSQTKKHKRLPVDLSTYDSKSLSELIGGLYDTDGTINITDNRAIIEITQVSKILLEDLRFLLHRFGIHASFETIRPRKRKRKVNGRIIVDSNEYYRLRISNHSSIVAFHKYIKFSLSYKQSLLSKAACLDNKGKCQDFAYTINPKGKQSIELVKNSDIYFETVRSIECIGEKDVYNLTTSDSHTYLANGIITHNTGGEMGRGADELEYIYYHPQEYDALEMDLSLYDEDVASGTQKVGYFVADWQYSKIDEDGNDDKEGAIEILDKKREEAEGSDGYNELIITMPRKPSDSFMLPSGGYFGKKVASQLNKRRSVVMSHKELMDKKRIGNLHWVREGNTIVGIEWEDDPFGDIQVFEHPIMVNDKNQVLKDDDGELILNQGGVVPNGLYYIGTDSYDKDEAKSTTSKGACIVRKGFFNAHETANFFCAKVFMREEKAYDFYENTAKLSYYYNGLNLIEWSNILIFDYYHRKGYDFLLMPRPDLMISRWIINSSVNNQYGIDPSSKRNWLSILKQALKEPGEIDRMLDTDLMRAFINFKLDPSYNCDLTIAASLCMVQVNEVLALDEHDDTEDRNQKTKPMFGFKKVNGVMRWTS